jgi:ABC-type multidrug transport system permease subunit
MKDFLIYTLVLFLAFFMSQFFGFILMFIGSFITDLSRILFKTKDRGKFFDVILFIQALCATFLTVIIIKIILNIFMLNLGWIFITVLITFFVINGIRRIRVSMGQDRIFEIYETIADIAGILIGFLLF